jgi:uroporphyrinogen III methyltransferase/synthase
VRVIVTRAAEQSGSLVHALRAHGFEVAECPLIRVQRIDDGPIETSAYEWVVVTSANGAAELARRHAGRLPRVAAIGPATAATLAEHGIAVDFVPSSATQDALVAEFPRPYGRILFVGAESARRLLVSELGADFRPVYRTVELRPDPPPEGDLVVLASPSAARAFGALGRPIPAVTIGPQTTAAALDAGVDVRAEARTHDLEGVVSAVEAVAAQ